MKKAPSRFLVAITATVILVLTCYGLARALLYYEAAQAEYMMRELGNVKIGDSEAEVLPLLKRYGGWRRVLKPYTTADKTDYEYMVDIGPSGIYYIVDRANTSLCDHMTRAVLGNLNPRLRRAIGLRRWNVYGRVGFRDEKAKIIQGEVMVEGSHEWLRGAGGLQSTIPPYEIRTFVTSPGISWPHDANHYLVVWGGRLVAMAIQDGGGEGSGVYVTPAATDEEQRSVYEFKWQCLTSHSGCQTVCDLYPATEEYANSMTLHGKMELCHQPSPWNSYW